MWPDDVNDWKSRRAESVLALFREMMKSENFRRGDQRTFIELMVIYLSGIVLRPRKNQDPQPIVPYRLCRPIATNQTRFMGIGIHEMIIGLLKNQFRQDNEGDDQSQALCEILCLLHGPYSVQVRDAITAPRLDLEYYINLLKYRNLHPPGSHRYRMAEAMINSFLLHTWMLTQEIVIFCLWDENLPARVRRGVADKVMAAQHPEMKIGKPDLPKELGNNPKLQDLVGPRSHLFFWLLRIGTNWLAQPVSRWKNDPEYIRVRDWLKELKVVNDCAERCIKDITEYANAAQDSQHRDNILLVVEDHRFVMKDITRDGLANANL